MPESLLVLLSAVSIAIAVRAVIAVALYRAAHPYGEEDLELARRDAVKRSRSALGGRSAEQLAPLIGEFAERFDPADARFLGAPVDFIVFDGLGRRALREVVLVEIKTGGGKLNSNERAVRDAIAEGRVSYELIRLGP